MKEKTQTKLPEWMESEEFKEYERRMKSNQERGFQKKLSQWKSEMEQKDSRHQMFTEGLKRVMANPEAIQYIAKENPELAQEIMQVVPKSFFEAKEGEVKIDMPNLFIDREKIIADYEKEKASQNRQAFIDGLYDKFYDAYGLSDEERIEFEKSTNELLGGETDLSRIEKLFGYSQNDFTKKHLVDDALASQMGNFNGMGTGQQQDVDPTQGGDLKQFRDSL